DILGDPVRRRILELLATGEHCSGDIVAVIQREFGITQPAVSQHLKVLRESCFTSVRSDGARRIYAIEAAPLREVDAWLDQFRRFWVHRLGAPAAAIARGKRQPPQPGACSRRSESAIAPRALPPPIREANGGEGSGVGRRAFC